MLGVVDYATDCVWLAVPETTERQCIGNEFDAAMIVARADFINVCFATLAHNDKQRWKSANLL